ncbi:MAG: family 78 glycoside hydrolase catalytic domain [Clostridia bacterium]|nr:family 78 glycoside hydrolase catalytic domain [Clostridia bacterium]
MFKKADLSNSKWIGSGKKNFPVDILTEITLNKNYKVTITIGCMGTFRLYVNGKKVSDDLFQPLNTDFEKRYNMEYGGHPFDEEFRHRLYCPVYDITDYLSEGKNEILFMLGSGFYEEYDYGNSKICWKIDITDENNNTRTVFSDGTEKMRESFVKEANVIRGETHDYTSIAEWTNVEIQETPDTNYFIQDCPADKVSHIIKPKYLGNNIYDAGEVFAGYPVLRSKNASEIKVRYSELLDKNGNLDEEHIYGQHTNYITDGEEKLLFPQFTWLCFRYFEIIGDAEVVECHVTHSDVDVNSSFECSNDTLNWLYKAYIRTQLANMHAGIPSDCPHTERRGYTGDGQLTCAAAMMQLDAQKFYRKWIGDICDCQDEKTGHIQYTAPFVQSGGGPGGWGCAIVVVPYMYYKAYGEKEIFDETFHRMYKWFSYLEKHSENDLVTSDLPGVWCLGDWCVPEQNRLNKLSANAIPEPYVNTYFYIKSMEYFLEISEIIGIDTYTEDIKKRIQSKKKAIMNAYFSLETGDFAKNEQGANAFAIDLGLGDERTFLNMIKKYSVRKMYDTGIFGTDIATRVLFEKGRADIACMLLTSEEEISYYNQIKNGATTILEYWNGVRSQCHPMFGAVTRYLFEYILGIRQTKDSVAYESVIISPECMKEIPFAKGKITTIKGEISVEYDEREIKITVPEKINAVLKLNGNETELYSGKNVFLYK